jgi:hypothetical protein
MRRVFTFGCSVEKIDLSNEPIDMFDLNWDPYAKNRELFEVIKR